MENFENSEPMKEESSLDGIVMQDTQTPKKERKLQKVSLGTMVICILLTAVFVFMGTFASLSVFYEGEMNRAFSMAEALDLSKLSEIEKLFEEQFLYEIDREAQKEAIAQSYVYYSGDKYASYYSAEAWQEQMAASAGKSKGIGVSIVQNKNNQIEIVQVMRNGPAEAAGIQVGDIIDSVDGVSAEKIGFNGLPAVIVGQIGTSVNLGIIRNGVKMEISVIRGEYKPETILAEIITAVGGKKLGYVYITEFMSYDTTALDFFNAVIALQEEGVEGLIFDVRNNPGGDLDAVVPMLDFLLPEGPIVHLTDKDGVEFRVFESDAREIDLPMIVLANENSASAAELFTSSLKDYGKATLIGTKTYGKGCGQTGKSLKDGSVVFITNFLYDPPYSENYDGIGIYPDIEVELPEEWQNINLFLLPHDEDTQLLRAIAELAAMD